ncbi:MAG: sigma-54-dependent Fis family transcriptional regulator, partial [Candidatus Latescibacteria bacterium]|nr:sigma-54-dependent Fis family transcriptional regulator [Candidatus Latescibacterota bacterium]
VGDFREDLFYRLSIFPIRLPPLRERVDDIPLLVNHFLKIAEERFGVRPSEMSPAALEMLMRYQWPGNIRELENELYRAVVLVDSGEALLPRHFSDRICNPDSLVSDIEAIEVRYTDAVNRFRRQFVSHVLNQCGGNKSEAAKRLKMHRPNLIALLKKLEIS